MGQIQKFLCGNCEGCQALPLTRLEYRTIYAESKISAHKQARERANKILNFEAYIVYCHKKQHRMLVYLE